MGRTNDAIIYGGIVQLFVKGSAEDAQELAERLPSRTSRDHGQPFADIFKKFKGDFYAIDPLLFSPAEVIVTAIETGDTFRAGGRDNAMLEQAWAEADECTSHERLRMIPRILIVSDNSDPRSKGLAASFASAADRRRRAAGRYRLRHRHPRELRSRASTAPCPPL